MSPFPWSPTELEAWRAFEEGDLPRMPLPPQWPFGLTWRRSPTQNIQWTPSIDVIDKGEKYVIHVELPGVNKEDIEILTTTDNQVTIGGIRKVPANAKDEEYRRCESCYGPFSRSVQLGVRVDPDNVEASFENGVLEISVPKAKEAVSRKIEVKKK
ncbi:MAG: Hsp20/alpha crystallin family protein [Dehalococcoidia bacterium]